MKYCDYYDCDICNGNSVGMSLFVSGCPFHCKDCFNPETWDYNYGKEWTSEIEEKFLELVGRDYIKRVSILGGSPLCDENIKDVGLLVQKIRHYYPEKEIWIYTGYSWEDIMAYDLPFAFGNDNDNDRLAILHYIDVLVDGRFECDKKDLTIAFRGSKNQRIIDVKKSLESGNVILWDEVNE